MGSLAEIQDHLAHGRFAEAVVGMGELWEAAFDAQPGPGAELDKLGAMEAIDEALVHMRAAIEAAEAIGKSLHPIGMDVGWKIAKERFEREYFGRIVSRTDSVKDGAEAADLSTGIYRGIVMRIGLRSPRHRKASAVDELVLNGRRACGICRLFLSGRAPRCGEPGGDACQRRGAVLRQLKGRADA